MNDNNNQSSKKNLKENLRKHKEVQQHRTLLNNTLSACSFMFSHDKKSYGALSIYLNRLIDDDLKQRIA